MAAARGILITALATLLAGAAGGAASVAPGDGHCLDCHAEHYAWLGTCTSCHLGDAAAARAELAHHGMLAGAAATWCLPGSPVVARGVAMRDSLGCRRCHTVARQGERLAIDLDTVVWTRAQDELRTSLRQPATAMPDFRLAVAQSDTLIAALLGGADRAASQDVYEVRFTAGRSDTLQTFARLCGGCHTALGPTGPVGSGDRGPNLSGLLSGWYPAEQDARWDRDRLQRWVQNPRRLRPAAIMPPLVVTPDELDAIVRTLTPRHENAGGTPQAPPADRP